MARARRRIAWALGVCGLLVASLSAATLGWAGLPNESLTAETGLFGVYARLSLGLAERFETDEPVVETRIVLGPGGRDIRLAGELTDGAAKRLARLLEANPQVERIHLTSEGGLVDEGEALGKLIGKRGLATYVPDYCVSACTLAFVRGRERLMTKASRIGFHSPFEVGLFGQNFRSDGKDERAAYLAAGLTADFVEAVFKVAPDDLWSPEPERLLAAHVITQVVDTRHFPDSTLDDGDDLAHARTAVIRNVTPFDGFEAQAPEVIDAASGWYLASYRSGASEAEAYQGLRRIAARAVASAFRGAEDGATIALGRHLLRAMNAARLADPRSCAAIGAEGNLVIAEDVLGEEGETARKLVERALTRHPLPKFDVTALTIADNAQRPLSAAPPADCGALREAYADALARPKPEAAAALRALMYPAAAPPPTLEVSMAP